MNDTGYIVWFVCMAVAVALLLGLGTLRMAGVLRRHPGQGDEAEVHAHPRHVKDDEQHHHWYDRFHHAA